MSVVVEVSARKLEIPQVCACCGEAAHATMQATYTRQTGVRVVRHDTRGFAFPYCQDCLGHVERWRTAGTLGNVLFVVLAALGIVLLAKLGPLGLVLVVLGVIGRFAAAAAARAKIRRQLKPSCACPEVAVAYLGWSGTVSSFGFDSAAYAARFALGNRDKLVNVSQGLRQLLDQGAVPRMQVVASRTPPALAAALVAPARASDHRVLDWIARIEDYKGAEARRNALHRALGEIAEPSARHALLTAAGRIEVSAVLDKIDSLSTNAAKRRHLQKGIEDLRASELPPEMQTQHIGQLEARLREL